MSRNPELYQWADTIAMRFASLSKPQAFGLALWSFGMILARSCSLTAVADMLAPLLGQSFNTVRERLRDSYRETEAKAGKQRAELDATLCWAPWLAWILEGWQGKQLAIAADATRLGQRFVVRVISVVYRGCAVPSDSIFHAYFLAVLINRFNFAGATPLPETCFNPIADSQLLGGAYDASGSRL